MALKEIWKDLINSTEDVEGDDVSAEPINNIAHAVIKLEEESGNINTALDEIINIQEALLRGDEE